MAFQLADGEAQLGRRAQRIEQENGESVRGENVCHMLGEHARIVAAVVADRNPDLLAREVLLEIVRKPLCSSPHRIDVHAVGTHAHDAAQAARTEFEVFVETLGEFFHIVIDQVFNLLFGSFIVVAVKPCLRFFQHQLFQFVSHKFYWFYL